MITTVSFTAFINKYQNIILPIFKQFFLIPNRVNKIAEVFYLLVGPVLLELYQCLAICMYLSTPKHCVTFLNMPGFTVNKYVVIIHSPNSKHEVPSLVGCPRLYLQCSIFTIFSPPTV
jgi:hypothetical protein